MRLNMVNDGSKVGLLLADDLVRGWCACPPPMVCPTQRRRLADAFQEAHERGSHLLVLNAGVAQQQAAAGIRAEVIAREGPRQHALSQGPLGNRGVVARIRQVQDEVQAGVAVLRCKRARSQMGLHQLKEDRPPPRVDQAHAADVRGVVAFTDQLRQRNLRDGVAGAVEVAMRRSERGRQRLRQHHIAHAQRGEQRLAEGADVDDGRLRVQALHGGDRPAGEAELAVVVVLDDPPAAGARMFHELRRRASVMTEPSGYWCDGVTNIRRGGVRPGGHAMPPSPSIRMGRTLASVMASSLWNPQ